MDLILKILKVCGIQNSWIYKKTPFKCQFVENLSENSLKLLRIGN